MSFDEPRLIDPPADPHRLFTTWFNDADRSAKIKYAHAMCLSTVDRDGLPEGRIVLLEHFDDEGFVFFTDVDSPKARALKHSSQAALTFYWGPLDRQIRIRGPVEPATDELSDACFRKRPRGSQLTAWASRQSRPLPSRAELDASVARYHDQFEGEDDLPRPSYWRTYRLRPASLEFWQARAHRRHDRLRYTRDAGGAWVQTWLYP